MGAIVSLLHKLIAKLLYQQNLMVTTIAQKAVLAPYEASGLLPDPLRVEVIEVLSQSIYYPPAFSQPSNLGWEATLPI